MIVLSASWEMPRTVIKLPNPNLGDLKARKLHVNIRNSISGKFYSYKKSDSTYWPGNDHTPPQILSRYTLSCDLRLYRDKADELREFIEVYTGERWRLEYLDDTYRVHLTNHPVEFTAINDKGYKVVLIDNVPTMVQDRLGIYTTRLEFEGELFPRG